MGSDPFGSRRSSCPARACLRRFVASVRPAELCASLAPDEARFSPADMAGGWVGGSGSDPEWGLTPSARDVAVVRRERASAALSLRFARRSFVPLSLLTRLGFRPPTWPAGGLGVRGRTPNGVWPLRLAT